ncbi:MAG: threonine synthase [Bdellovibrio sp.]|nr:MAG: threonine synthase [Bdellovibrio sp.]
MKFISTRSGNAGSEFSLSEALELGLAPDGGLFVPQALPRLATQQLEIDAGFSRVAARVLAPFFANDSLVSHLPAICEEAFDFPVLLKRFDDHASILELFHGPTLAFKDFGARFLAAVMARMQGRGEKNILVATSGDTGGAVAAAFHAAHAGRRGFRVSVLFPLGKVASRQQHQLTAWGGNVQAFAVKGSFDDCQRIVKEAFADRDFPRRETLTSANSINIGRLLPQMAYYIYAAEKYFRESGKTANVIIPAGNLGNAMGAFYAKEMGAPIGKIGLATNANRPIPDFFQSGRWQPQPSIPTLANAMDVGNPSNIERLFHLYSAKDAANDVANNAAAHAGGTDLAGAAHAILRRFSFSRSVADEEIRKEIRRAFEHEKVILCPHTATASYLYRHLPNDLRPLGWILVATAHPAKFETIVEPLIGQAVDVPRALTEILQRQESFKIIEPDLASFRSAFERSLEVLQ